LGYDNDDVNRKISKNTLNTVDEKVESCSYVNDYINDQYEKVNTSIYLYINDYIY